MKAIDNIESVPEYIKDKSAALSKFLAASLIVIIYAPDKDESDFSNALRKKFVENYGDTAELELDLEEYFFDRLYVHRDEKTDLENLIPSRRFILLHGHLGSGKTVLLRKIQHEHKQKNQKDFLYFDIKEEYSDLDTNKNNNFDEWIRDRVYNKVYDTFIHTDDRKVISNWEMYKITRDPGFIELEERLVSYIGERIDNPETWEILSSDEIVRQQLLLFDKRKPELTTLLRFVLEKLEILPIICFDNLDKFPLDLQWKIISFCIHLSDSIKIPVVASIRESNIRLLISEAMEGGGRKDLLADIFIVEFLDQLHAQEDDHVKMNEMQQASVQELLNKRLAFVKCHINKNKDKYKEIFNLLETLKSKSKLPKEIVYEKYLEEFWGAFEKINRAFADTQININYIFNDSCRELLKFYFNFISTICLNPEGDYNIEEIIGKRVEYTPLRTFLYKWLICNGSIIPKSITSIPNIYESLNESTLKIPRIRILETLYNWSNWYPNRRITFKELNKLFNKYRITRSALAKYLMELNIREGQYELGYIWLNCKDKSYITDTTSIELLPAGEHFLKTLSISREYAFWNILITELDTPILMKKESFREVYEDPFKLDVTYKFIKEVLLPKMMEEAQFIHDEFKGPKGWTHSNLDYYKRNFSIQGHLYTYRLIWSIIGTLESSNLSHDDFQTYNYDFNNLLNEAERLEHLHISTD